MAAILRDSSVVVVVAVVVVVVRTRPRAIPLAMITMRKFIDGFLRLPYTGCLWGSAWRPSPLQSASVYMISQAVWTSGEATEDPLKSEFLGSFRCKC